MAFEINDLRGILILVLFAISTVASTNINCSGKAFHCVNSTHFMICVDLGAGVSSTIDDFVIPCPATTVCHPNNVFECDFPEVTPTLEVIGVNRPSDTSDPILVTNSETTQAPTSDIVSVFNENITATTLPLAEDVTPVMKSEVLENIKRYVDVNSDNTTENSVISSLIINSTNYILNEKETKSNNTIATSDNNKNLDETSISKASYTSPTDKSISITSVVGLNHLISTDPPSEVTTKTSYNALTSLDNVATTTEQYITKEVIEHAKNVENVTDKLNIPTDTILNESIVTADEVSTTPMVNKLIVNDINKIEFNNETGSGNNTIYKQNSFRKNDTSKLATESKSEHFNPIKIDNISEQNPIHLSPHTTTDSNFVPLGLEYLISADRKEIVPSTNDYTTISYSNSVTASDLINSKPEITLMQNPANAEIINTMPRANTIGTNNNNLNGDTVAVEKVAEKNTNSFISKTMTEVNVQTEKDFIPATTETTIVHATETIVTSEAIFNNYDVENQTIVAQPSEINIAADLPIVTEKLYRVNDTKDVLNDTINTAKQISAMYSYSKTDIINDKITEPIVLLPPFMKKPTIEITKTETLQKEFTAPDKEVVNKSLAINITSSVNEPLLYVKNYNNTTESMNITEAVKIVIDALRPDTVNDIRTESTPKKYHTTVISTTENEFTKNATETVNESKNVRMNALLGTTPVPYKDLQLQTDITTNPPTGFTPEIIADNPLKSTSIYHSTTEKAVSGSVSKVPFLYLPDNVEAMIHPEILNVDQWTVTVPDAVSTTTTSIENKASPPFPSDVTRHINNSEIVKPDNQVTFARSFGNTEDVLLKIIETSTPPLNQYETELPRTTPVSVYTTPIMNYMKMFKQAVTTARKISDVHRQSTTTDYQIKTNTSFSVNATLNINNIENITDEIALTLPQQKLLNQKTYSTTTSPERVINFIPMAETTVGYVLDTINIDFNTSNQTDSVNMENTFSNVYLNLDGNKTETLNSINFENSTNATFFGSTEKINMNETIKTMSVLDTGNSSGNVIPIEILQSTSTNPVLSKDYIGTSVLQTSSVYVSTTVNIPNYNLVNIEETTTGLPFTETNVMDTVLPTLSTHNTPVPEIPKEKYLYVSNQAPTPSTVEIEHINPTIEAIDYVTQNTNDYLSTETILRQLNKISNVQEAISSSVPTSPATASVLTKVPVYDKNTSVKDSAFILSSTQMTPEVITENNIEMYTELPRFTLKATGPQVVKYKTASTLPFAPMTTESTQTTILAKTTSLDKSTLNTESGLKTTDSPQFVMTTVNINIPQSKASQPMVGVTTAQITTESTNAALFAPTTPINKMNQNEPEIKYTDYPQLLTSKVDNDSSPQPMASLSVVEATAAQSTTDLTHPATNARTTPLVATANTIKTVLLGIETRDSPQYVMPRANSNIAQLKPSLPIQKVTDSQITTKPTDTTNVSAETVPLTLPRRISQNTDNQPGIFTKDLSQHLTTTTLNYNNPPIIDLTTKTITDSQIVPNSMVETIKVVGEKVSSVSNGETILGDAMFNTSTVNNVTYSVNSVKNIIDHESLIVKTTSKNNEQSTPIISDKPVDINKAEIVNHTESNSMPSDNIDSVKMKESFMEEEDLQSKVLKSGLKFQNKSAVLNSTIILEMQPRDGKLVNKTTYGLSTVTTDYKKEYMSPNNVTQSKAISTNENKNTQMNSLVNIEVINVKKYRIPFDSNIIFNNYSMNNTKANNTSLNHNFSSQNSTINDKLEQHLTSTNHTITSEIQSYLNESDKQSNKTSNELTLNGISVYNLNLASTKLNASSENITIVTIPASGFNCWNLTRGKYADKNDCRKFYTCVGNLQPVLGTCPNNTVFSEINKQCTRNLSHCVRNNQFRCLFDGRFSDFFKDNIYYICVKNRMNGFIRYKLQCLDNYHLNKNLVKCEKNDEVATQSVSSISEAITDESKLPTKSDKVASSDDFECENDGKFPHSKDCSKYYICTKVNGVYRRKIKKCAIDEVFDKKKKECVESDSGEC